MSWSEIKKAINSNLGIPLDVLVKEETKKVDSNLSALFNELLSKKFGEFSVVRSVQRGIFNFHSGEAPSQERIIYISPVNPAKCLVIINSQLAHGVYDISNKGVILGGIDATQVRFVYTATDAYYNSEAWTDCSWQIIEFY